MGSILTTEDKLSKITKISYYFSKKNLKKKKIFPECRFPLILIEICHVNMTSLIYFCPRDNYRRPCVHYSAKEHYYHRILLK